MKIERRTNGPDKLSPCRVSRRLFALRSRSGAANVCLCIATGSGLSRVSRDDRIAGIGSVKIEDGLLQRLDDRKIDAGTRDPAPWPTTCSRNVWKTMNHLHLANHGATPLQFKKKNQTLPFLTDQKTRNLARIPFSLRFKHLLYSAYGNHHAHWLPLADERHASVPRTYSAADRIPTPM